MRKKRTIILILIICMTAVGCSHLPSLNKKNSEKDETVIAEEPEEPKEESNEQSTRDEKFEVEKQVVEQEPEKNQQNIVLGDYNILLGGEVVEGKDNIQIYGESNLIPGARVVGEVFVGDEKEPDFFTDTSEKVADDGTYYMELSHPQMDNSKEINVQVKFHFDTQQSDEVIRHYGERGQKLEGPYIYKHRKEVGGRSNKDIYDMAKVTAIFEPKDTLSVRQFKEPKWYDIPDDIGDPRVWIEVDEINDDSEFYYLHGRSNLVEGSELQVEYGFNRDNALVQPDGSFDFKFDYEYREDTPFVVYFKPYNYQWNTVEEVYGMEGQNLVGNLVETTSSNKQYIKKEIEDESQEIKVPDHVELNVDGSEVTMLVPDDVLFDFDKFDLKDSSKKVLKEIAETLDTSFNKDKLEIIITGHTDNVGEDDYNLDLSEKRADEVKKYLKKRLESDRASFTTEGIGAEEPIASNDTEKGQAKNRRVEIVVNFK